jgi:hypothetical protein
VAPEGGAQTVIEKRIQHTKSSSRAETIKNRHQVLQCRT